MPRSTSFWRSSRLMRADSQTSLSTCASLSTSHRRKMLAPRSFTSTSSLSGEQHRADHLEKEAGMKALVIDEPWITAILKGDKTWEMRKKNCKIRGEIALIRKGSGLVVGTAHVVDSRPLIATRGD